jgi:amidophosphoribosyltransferase
VFQTLEDLKAACIEAAIGKSQVQDLRLVSFVASTRHQYPDYLERSSLLHGNKTTISTGQQGDAGTVLAASSGPVNAPGPQEALPDDGVKMLEKHKDIRYTHYPDMQQLTSED